jgi:hypothetical protein
MKPWKQGRQGTRLKDWLLTGPGGGVSWMPYAPEGATGNDDDDYDVIVPARKQDLSPFSGLQKIPETDSNHSHVVKYLCRNIKITRYLFLFVY